MISETTDLYTGITVYKSVVSVSSAMINRKEIQYE